MKKTLIALWILVINSTHAQTTNSSLKWNDQNFIRLSNTLIEREQIQELGGKVYLGSPSDTVSRYITFAKIMLSKEQTAYGFLESINLESTLFLVSAGVFRSYVDALRFYEARFKNIRFKKTIRPFFSIFFSSSSGSYFYEKLNREILEEFLNIGDLKFLAKKPPIIERFDKAFENGKEMVSDVFRSDHTPFRLDIDQNHGHLINELGEVSTGVGIPKGVPNSKVIPDAGIRVKAQYIFFGANTVEEVKINLGLLSGIQYEAGGMESEDVGISINAVKSTPLSTRYYSIGLRAATGARQPYRYLSFEFCPISGGSMRSLLFSGANEKVYNLPNDFNSFVYSPSGQINFALPLLGEQSDGPPIVFLQSKNDFSFFTPGFYKHDRKLSGYQFYSRSELGITLSPIIIKAFYEYLQASFEVPTQTDMSVTRTANASCSVIGVSGVYVFGTK